MLVFSCLLAVVGMLGVVIFLLMPSGGMSGRTLLLLKTGTVALHLIPIAIGVRWFIYFTRTNVKAYFQTPRKAPLAFAPATATVEEAFRPSALPVPAGNVAIADYDESRKSLSSFRRWLLLYKPPRGRAWIARLFFYVMVAETVFLPLMLAASPGDRQAGPFLFFSSLFWIAVLRALSVGLEKPRSHSQGN